MSPRCALITPTNVGALYAKRVIEALRTAGFDPHLVQIPDGETFKTLDTARTLYDQLIDAGLDRHSAILALGGGVTGDLAGFVAATLLRGIPFVQLPTTLLAMVDASIGGKVAVDHPRGKNLIGAFIHPRAVLADVATLATLPVEEWRAGMAEVIKHGILDAELFEELEAGGWKSTTKTEPFKLGNWIARAMRVKVDIVARDPLEQNERAKLNLGHTFGHALEKLSNYELRHGHAVAIGLVWAARLAERLGLAQADLATRIEQLVREVGLSTYVPPAMTAEAILDAMQTDKKRFGAQLRFVLPRAPGEVTLVADVTYADIVAAIPREKI